MKKKSIPEWMQQKKPLKNKEVYNALITMSTWVVDPALQTIYEYAQDLEKANYELINQVDFLKEQIEDLRKVIGKLKEEKIA